jgi:hypothetical protein
LEGNAIDGKSQDLLGEGKRKRGGRKAYVFMSNTNSSSRACVQSNKRGRKKGKACFPHTGTPTAPPLKKTMSNPNPILSLSHLVSF